MVLHIKNPDEDTKTEDIAKEMIGKRTFMGWPFLQEGLVVAISDSLFTVVARSPPKVVSNPHSPHGIGQKAERIET